ncbi:hypothetical protein J6590_006471 [Homalodisca vitripennis]|nr:hypothetical protein J6590_006471 [Homalodisca vitripennis]
MPALKMTSNQFSLSLNLTRPETGGDIVINPRSRCETLAVGLPVTMLISGRRVRMSRVGPDGLGPYQRGRYECQCAASPRLGVREEMRASLRPACVCVRIHLRIEISPFPPTPPYLNSPLLPPGPRPSRSVPSPIYQNNGRTIVPTYGVPVPLNKSCTTLHAAR